MLWTVNLAVTGCLCMIVLASPCCCEPLVGNDNAMYRPSRPKSFASPDDLRSYLDQLGQYFAVVGRPRFGKRNLFNSPIASKPVYKDSRYFNEPTYAAATDNSEYYDLPPLYLHEE